MSLSSSSASSSGSPRHPKYAALSQSSPARSTASADSRVTSQSQLARVGGYLQERLAGSPERKRLPGVEALVTFLDGEEETFATEARDINNALREARSQIASEQQADRHSTIDGSTSASPPQTAANGVRSPMKLHTVLGNPLQGLAFEQSASALAPSNIAAPAAPPAQSPPHTHRASTRQVSQSSPRYDQLRQTSSQQGALSAARGEISRLQSEMSTVQGLVEKLRAEQSNLGKQRFATNDGNHGAADTAQSEKIGLASETEILDFVRKVDSLVWLKRDLPHRDDRRRDDAVFTSANLVHLGKRVQAWEDAIRRRA